MFARLESVDRYVAAKITPRTWGGSEYTDSGNRWEPVILAYLDVPGNKALIHAPGNRRFFATPDGITPDGSLMAEVKTRHEVIKPMPDAGEWRQLAWQFICVPEAEMIRFGTATVLRDVHGGWELRENGLDRLDVARDHPRIVGAMEQVGPIADRVLAALDRARAALTTPF